MRKHMMRVVNANPFSKFFRAAALVLVISSSSAITYAAATPASIVSKDPGINNTVINHVSTDSESFLFEVKLDNTTGERFSVIIKDEGNNTIYRGWFSDKEFNRKFRLPKSESSKVTFIIRSESGKAAEAFEVNTNRRVVEDIVVKKVL